ncbi:hypothetical protein ACVWWG_002581 [Bradyrhizobium sp. LB7.2]
MRETVEHAIEDARESVPATCEKVPARRRPLLLVRNEQKRGQRRRQRQGAEAGDCGRNRNGDGELLKELSGNTAQERGRDEYRAQHQRDRHQCAADLLHGLQRGVAPAYAVLEMSLDILDHHDGVVDHNADGENETEQREIVDGEAERRHHREGADQRDRNRDDRNDRGSPSLKEHQHHDHHKQHGLVDGLDQLMDGLRDELGRVVADIVVEAFRKGLLQLRHRVRDLFRGREGVRSGPLRHQHGDRRFAQQEAVGGVRQRTELDTRDVAQAHRTAVGAGLDQDVLELLLVFQAPGEGEVRLEGAVGNRRFGDLAARDLHVLRADRGEHFG